MKKLLAGSGIVAGVLALGLVLGYWHFSHLMPMPGETAGEASDQEAGAVAALSTPSPPPADAQAGSPAQPETAQTAPVATPAAEAPAAETAAFTLLRVEPDGSALLAGRATPSGEVVIRSGDTVLAREDVSAGGDFVVTLEEPLAVGDHELTLEAVGADGRTALAPEVAIVSVPDPERPEDLLVAVGAPDAPTRLVAVPAAPAEPPRTIEPAQTEPRLDAATSAEPAPEALRGASDDFRPTETSGPSPDLSIAAVEIENERIFVAGSARPGATIRIYLDGEFIAEADDEGDRFIAEAIAEVPVGSHIVRADEIGPDGSVLARVEVPFERPDAPSMAALAPRLDRAREHAPRPAPVAPGPAAPATAQAASAPVPDGDRTPSTAPLSALRGADGTDGTPEAELAAVATQPALQPVEGRVIIRRGDTLWRISRETYGQGRRYTTIYLANGDQIRDPDLIYPGQIFRMPVDSDTQERATN